LELRPRTSSLFLAQRSGLVKPIQQNHQYLGVTQRESGATLAAGVKFSTKSNSLVGSHKPRSINSNDTRRGSSSRSFVSTPLKRSQSAVSEPTRLSAPFEAISSAL